MSIICNTWCFVRYQPLEFLTHVKRAYRNGLRLFTGFQFPGVELHEGRLYK